MSQQGHIHWTHATETTHHSGIAIINSNPSLRQHDDEIDLVDLARALIRRKWWIIATFVIFTLSALVYASQQERDYAFTTSIQLAEFGSNEFVAGASDTQNTIENRILLNATRTFLQERGDEAGSAFDVSVSTAEQSNFVNLVSEMPLDRQSTVTDFHRHIFERLRDEHQSRLSILEDESNSRMETLQEALASEKRRMTILKGMSVQPAQQGSQEEGVKTEAQGGDTLEAQLSSTDGTLARMLSQLQINERISQGERRINKLRGDLRDEKARRSWIKPTRAEELAIASLSPVGTGSSLIVVLGALLGAIFGVFMALFAEFAGRVRDRH